MIIQFFPCTTPNSQGIGLVTVRRLAKSGTHVIVATRSISKGEAVVFAIQSVWRWALDPSSFLRLDLAPLASIRSFVASFKTKNLLLHVLVNNAGVMKSLEAMFVGRNLTYG